MFFKIGVPVGKKRTEYSIPLEKLAQMVADHTAGFKNAEPEFDDYELAVELIRLIDTRYDND